VESSVILRGESTRTNHLSNGRPFKDEDHPELCLKIKLVPRSKHTISIIKTSQLILYREIIAVFSEIHTKHINTVCGQNVEFLNVKLVVHILTTVRYI
jgi:hypothetical protein